MIEDFEMNDFGIINVYKPVGMTSFAVVSRIRRIFAVKKAGHCGTLDPFAEGVLPVCVGKATRVIRYMDGYDKSYRCVMGFGSQTDTEDTEGSVVLTNEPSEGDVARLRGTDFAEIREILSRFQGALEQIPPMYSALKVDGRPLYSYARDGVMLERKARNITVHKLQIHSVSYTDELRADFSVDCSKGTYIRSICRDVGAVSGFYGHAQKLQRTACGPFALETAHTLEALEAYAAEGDVRELLLPETVVLSRLPRLDLTETEAARLRMGQRLPFADFAARIGAVCETEESYGKLFVSFLDDEPVAVLEPSLRDGVPLLGIERVFA